MAAHRFALLPLAVLSCSLAIPVGSAAQDVDFAHDVLPLLKTRCARCHSDGTYKGGFSLDTRSDLIDSGAVEVGSSADSSLVERVSTSDVKTRMPQEDDPLTQGEISVLSRWIDQGLDWEEGFSFLSSNYQAPLQLRAVPLPQGPEGGHPVDQLLGAYARQRGLGPLQRTGDAALARRVYLDLVGLLPAAEQLESFLADSDPDKRAALVRSLLDDRQAYAEHWLTFWNDLLRNDYQGTGYIDGGRTQITAWLYRSLTENKPFDKFAAELINPSADSEGFIKGINWRGKINASQIPDLQFAQNVSQVFLGVNLKCASCHDSFIDDWKLADAYGMAAIAANRPLEIHRCDKPTGVIAQAKFLFPQLGQLDPALPRDGRLQQLAALVTAGDNGRFARTIVNRLWQRLMGRGLVEPVDVMSGRPWSEDLLEYLAGYLVERQFDLQSLLELIATSNAYQSNCAPAGAADHREYVFAGPLARRMTAEQFMDAVWQITDTWPKAPAVDFAQRNAAPVRAALVDSDRLMRVLGRPNREQVVSTRPQELTTLEALDLTNGQQLVELLQQGASRIAARFDQQSDEAMVQWIYLSALGRQPTPEELTISLPLIRSQDGGRSADQIADLLWALFMLPEFQLVQ